MNITPIEIRQKEFERHFRGYDKDEVNAFLHTLSQAWERLLQENREKTARLEKAEKDIDKVREVEGALFRTLRTAEDTSAGIVNKAQKEADDVQEQAVRQSQEIIEDAHRQAASIIEEAHQQVARLKQEVTEAETHRQQALARLQALAQGILQQIGDDVSTTESVPDSVDNQPAPPVETTETSAEENPAEHQYSDTVEVSNEKEASSIPEEAPTQQEAPDEVYEPVWATDEADPALVPSKAAGLKRRSFFDELD
ncbi:MAG: DivIVA domain-containing protein [Tunicatimonas sp.]